MHTELEHEQATARLLRALPEDAARPYDWHEFQRRAHAAPAAAARVAGLRALAAVLVIGLAIGATVIRFGGVSRPAAPATDPVGAEGAVAVVPDQTEAENWLDSLPREPGLVRVGTRAAVATLEDHIAAVDDLLSSERLGRAPPARLRALQQERAQLVNSLVQVRYAETLADASR